MVKIGRYDIKRYSKPVFIAELGINHDGYMYRACDMIDEAANAGADIVKFQYHLPNQEMLQGHEWQELMTNCYLSFNQLNELKDYTESQTGMMFLCTPFCKEAADDLNAIGVEAFKTGSGEFNNIPFLRHVASFNKPMIVSTGMSSRDEFIRSLDMLQKLNQYNLILMNCTSTYPATFAQSRLKRINWLHTMTNPSIPIGQSDHTPTIATVLGAIAYGAVVIEKHMTLDRNAKGPDHAASILPGEFKQMVEMGKQIWEGMQDGTEANMGIVVEEYKVRKVANHSVVTLVDIKEGDTFTAENIGVKRVGQKGLHSSHNCPYFNGECLCTKDEKIKRAKPATMPAKMYDEVMGRVASNYLTADTCLFYSDIVP